jgi:hypothetical protein
MPASVGVGFTLFPAVNLRWRATPASGDMIRVSQGVTPGVPRDTIEGGRGSLRVQRHRNTVVVGRVGGAGSVALAVGVRTSTHTFEPVVD